MKISRCYLINKNVAKYTRMFILLITRNEYYIKNVVDTRNEKNKINEKN